MLGRSNDAGTRKPARAGGGGPRGHAVRLLAGALLLLLLTGCSGSGTERGTDALLSAVPAADRDRLREGGSLVWAVDDLPATLNTFRYDADPVTDRVTVGLLPRLFVTDERGRQHPDPDYLRSAGAEPEGDGWRIVYALNPRAVWSDGEPVGAEDFIAQWKALNGSDNSYWSARNAGYERISEVRQGPGEHEVTVLTEDTVADWRALFTPLYPRSLTGDPAAFNNGARDDLPATAGPFTLEGVDREAGRMTLARDDGWWGDRALLDELVYLRVPRHRRLEELGRGTVHVAEVDAVTADRVLAAAGTPSRGGGVDSPHAPPGPEEGDGPEGGEPDGGPPGNGQGPDDGRGAPSAEPPANGPGTGGTGIEAAEAPGTATLSVGRDLAAHLVRWGDARLAAVAPDAPVAAAAAADRAAERYAGALVTAQRSRDRAFALREESALEHLARYTVHRAYGPSWTQLAINGSSSALRDERVRRALALALDREAPAAEVHGAAGLPPRPLGHHLWVPAQEEYRDHGGALGESGPRAAAEVLEAAGWHRVPGGGRESGGDGDPTTDADAGSDTPESPAAGVSPAAGPPAPVGVRSLFRVADPLTTAEQGVGLLRRAAADSRVAAARAGRTERARLERVADEAERAAEVANRKVERLADEAAAAVRVKEGTPLRLSFVVPEAGTGAERDRGIDELHTVADLITDALTEVGVLVDRVEVPVDTYLSERIPSGDFDLALYSWPATPFPATDAHPMYAKPQAVPGGEVFIRQNYSRVGTDHIDQLLEEAATEPDAGRRAELLHRVDLRLWAEAGSIPLYQRPELVAAERDLANVGAFGLATPRPQDFGRRR
ncbi:ABC transporter family substrate-binding protein [Streptomyces alkaliphilus]|uniref:ABC transporter family substrate-binding protein n=1 Tax=Streptomyces alkaliphilus TaxID=1472722 RepID=A0A7W3TA44_9ACTN|nr:ABC transporter substrate-binding protein [Streptomyces alkaliphilus]MBB0243046.1 ABC transporter family substrate-binding protein [Streptomyces alkaliphilus]